MCRTHYPRCMWCGPQFFCAADRALAQCSAERAEVQIELALVRSQNVDITKFETQLDGSRRRLGATGAWPLRGFEETVKHDETIKDLEKTRKRCKSITTCAWPMTRPTT